jgi:hypothetical protein
VQEPLHAFLAQRVDLVEDPSAHPQPGLGRRALDRGQGGLGRIERLVQSSRRAVGFPILSFYPYPYPFILLSFCQEHVEGQHPDWGVTGCYCPD